MYLPLAEFAHNNWKNATTGESPFYLLMGSHPRAEWSDAPSALPQVTRRLGQIKEIRARAQEAMTRAQMMWVKHRDTPKYHEGDLVWLEGRNLRTNQPTAKLAARRHGPFPVEQALSPVTYKLSLPPTWNVHPVFHIDLLTPYRETRSMGGTMSALLLTSSPIRRSTKSKRFWTYATTGERGPGSTWSSGRDTRTVITNG